MVNEFYEDTKGERRELVRRIVNEVEPHYSDGAGTVRFFHGNIVVKAAAHKNGVFTPEAVERNVKLLSGAGIQFPDTTLGVYNLSNTEHFWQNTPVVVQETADLTFEQSFSKGNPTEKTYFMLKRTVDVVDRAVANDLVIDDSLSNFGLFGNTVALMDIQDENSVKKNVKGEFEKMYAALSTSMVRYGADRKEVEELIERESKFF